MANTQIKQHVPIFISSTYEDLIPYRNEVNRVLNRLEQIVKGMEYFGSNPQDSLSVCLSQLKECKLCISIIGMRYGSIDDKTGLSYTQLEYNEAIKQGIPTLIYIIDENYPIPSKYVDRDNKAEKLEAFKTELKKRHTVSFFKSPEDLGNKLSNDVINVLSSLEEISIDSENAVNIQEDNFVDVINKFLKRPAKYQGFEGILTMRVLSEPCGGIKNRLLSAFGLELGNTLYIYTSILDKNKDENEKNFYVYADGKCADWLEKVSKGCIIKVKVKTVYGVVKEFYSHDSGKILRDVTNIGLVITEGISIQYEKDTTN